MKKSLLYIGIGILGVFLFLGSLHLWMRLSQGEKVAVSKDDEKTVYGMIDENAPLPCSWEVQEADRVMGEDKSQGIAINVTGFPDTDCASIISLRAPDFDTSPREESQTVNLASSQSGSLSWIISPRKTGSYEIAVSDILNTKIVGITVTDTFGLSAMQAKIASILGTLFGPMLTFPWWWEKLRKRKPDDKKEA